MAQGHDQALQAEAVHQRAAGSVHFLGRQRRVLRSDLEIPLEQRLQFFLVDLDDVGRLQRSAGEGLVDLSGAQVEVEEARRRRGVQHGRQRLSRARAALGQGAEIDQVGAALAEGGGDAVQRRLRVDEIVGLARQDGETMAVALPGALHHHASGFFHRIKLQPGVGHHETLELGAHGLAVAVVADAGDDQRRRHEGGQVARHVEGGAADHRPGREFVDQGFAEDDGGHGGGAHLGRTGTVSRNEARSDSLSNRRARFG